MPRDREGSYEPLLIGKHQRRFEGCDLKIISMYARGITVHESRDIQEMPGAEVSPDFISQV